MHKKISIKYPKLLLLIATIIIALVLFQEGRHYEPFHNFLKSLGYLGIFIAGILYSYGFTATPAAAILLALASEGNIMLAVFIGGLGALVSDILIFLFVRHSLMDEIRQLGDKKIMRILAEKQKSIFGRLSKYILPVFAGFMIASPLPSEIGISMMAGIKGISIPKFLVIAYVLHSMGILVILAAGRLIF